MPTSKRRKTQRLVSAKDTQHFGLSTDPERHAKAWASLAPAGRDLAGRQAELAHLCKALFREGRTPDDLLRLWGIIRAYATKEQWASPGALSRNRQLAKDAMAAVRSAKNALRELIRICRNAENTIPLALTDAPRRDGPSWAESLQQLEGALATIDAAPALTFLRRFESQTGVSGDPIKRRNGRLRRELKANGLTREQATTVLVSLLFLQRRTRTRRGRR